MNTGFIFLFSIQFKVAALAQSTAWFNPHKGSSTGNVHSFKTRPFDLAFNREHHMVVPKEEYVANVPSYYVSADLNPGVATNYGVLQVNTNKQFQRMEGVGAALTETSVLNILKLPKDQQDTLLETLFHPVFGAGMNLIRVPMGSSDLADGSKGEYTYDDSPGNIPDPQMTYFSMERDSKTLELLNRIKAINPNIKIMINPWTAPPWMKSNKAYNRGRFRSKYTNAFVNYFIRTIREYQAHGLEVNYLGIQNEPGISVDYPSMLMSDDQQALVILRLGERLTQEGLATQIIANDDNYNSMPRVLKLLKNPKVKEQIAAAGFHCWSNDIEKLQHLPSDVMTFETECGGNINSFDYGSDFYWWLNNRVITGTKLGLSAIIAWNMVSDEEAGPHGLGPQGCKTCRGLVTVRSQMSVDGSSGAATEGFVFEKNSEFRALMHLSKFVQRGARRVEVTFKKNSSLDPFVTAFQNPDDSVVVVVSNPDQAAQELNIMVNGMSMGVQSMAPGESQTWVF